MKTDLTTSGSFAQSKALAKSAETKTNTPKLVPQNLSSSSGPDYKLDLGSKLPVPPLPSMPVMPSIPSMVDAPKIAKDKIKDEVIDEAREAAKIEVKIGTVKKPAIFFIKGLDIFSSPLKSEGGYAGVGRIAESIEGSRIYGWDQKEEILKEIRKVHKDYPVILVGHSLGGDTAVEVADELDSLKENFRSVDLLITIDAVGFGHDIIPQNVKNHLNVFGEGNIILNDGPHVARREENTIVRNILSPLDHTAIDDDREVQYEIVNLIQNTLKA